MALKEKIRRLRNSMFSESVNIDKIIKLNWSSVEHLKISDKTIRDLNNNLETLRKIALEIKERYKEGKDCSDLVSRFEKVLVSINTLVTSGISDKVEAIRTFLLWFG